MPDLRPFRTACTLTVTLTAAGMSAQAVDRGPAVDPNVGDRDPNSTSLRFVDPGNAQHSFAARITTTDFRSNWSPFQAVEPIATDPTTGLPVSQGFQYRAPGVRALMDRPDYLADIDGDVPGLNMQPSADGRQAVIIPANTVFQLTLERPRVEAETPAPVAANYMDLRVSPLPMQSVPLRNPVNFSRDGHAGVGQVVDASLLRFPAAALAAQPEGLPTPDMPDIVTGERPVVPDADPAAASDTE
ncbi:MAG: hypothetical protein AAF333_17205 [Planctomycetota bacterium]